MNLLLDTHVFLWLSSDPDRLPNSLMKTLRSESTACYVSNVSAWEIAIKYRLGKLELPMPPTEFWKSQLADQCLIEIPAATDHMLAVAELPRGHGDPFDLLLVAQAQSEFLTLVSADRHLSEYEIEPLWG